MKTFILLLMIFLHIVDDFHLQGCLANLKQKKWWKNNYPNPMYKDDYIIGLFVHSFGWAFLIMLPLAIITHIGALFIIMFAWNVIVHAIIDDMKANKESINLATDQLVHLLQIVLTWVLLY